MALQELKAASQARATSSRTDPGAEDASSDADSADLYATLGLPRGSGPEDIKAAYRRAAKECHPDARPGDAAAAARFREVSNAHTTLLHVGLRRMYDLHLQRQEAQERCDKQEEQDRTPRQRVAVSAVVISLGTLLAGGCAWALHSPGFFWAFFRGIPDWMPGKWRLAEFYSLHARRQQEAAAA